jgi:hypothetical protein
MQSLAIPTLLLGSDAFIEYVFFISSSLPFEQGGIPLSLNTLPPSPMVISFVWNDLGESSSPSLHDFLDVEFPSDETILEAMLIDF